MELFQELMFTVGLSLLVFFVIAKHFSMASSSDPAGDNSVSVSVIGVITEQNRPQKSVVWDSASERRVCFVDEAVEFDELVEEPRAEAVGSPLICGDEEVDDGEEVFEEFLNVGLENEDLRASVFREEAKGQVLNEEREAVGGVEFEANLFDECSKWEKFREIGIESEDFVEKCSEMAGVREIGIESGNDGESVAKFEEVRVLESEDNKRNESVDEIGGKEAGFFDDWEGIERTELEKRFGDAVVFAGSKSTADRISSLDNDSKMQLYGLHKVAIEGRCRLPQPMALKVSARAKWNAWRQLGDMNREVAMEQYIALMSRSIPGWMGGDTEDGKQVSSDAGASTNLPFNLHKLVGTENESISEERKPCDGGCGMIGVEGFEGSNSVNRDAWSEIEDMDLAIVLSLSEEDKGKSVVDNESQLKEDEQLAKAIQESLNVESPPQHVNGNIYQPIPFPYSTGFRTCAGCNTEIGHGRFLNCMGAVWHPECFRCHACHQPICDYEFSMSGNYPHHKSCYKENYHPKCDGCKHFIPTNAAGLIEYRAHPFWVQKYCPVHENDGTPRCCSCERMEV